MGRLIGFVLGLVGAISVLLLLFRRRKEISPARTFERRLTVITVNGKCRIEHPPSEVVLNQKRRDQVHWIVTHRGESPCPERIEVCMGNWKYEGKGDEIPTEDLDDDNHCKEVKRGHSKRIRARAKKKDDAPQGEYKYSVLIDGDEVLDPIVRLVI